MCSAFRFCSAVYFDLSPRGMGVLPSESLMINADQRDPVRLRTAKQKECWMPKARRGWTMPEEDARSMLLMIEERIRASDIRVEDRDALIRLWAMIEDDLGAVEKHPDQMFDPARIDNRQG